MKLRLTESQFNRLQQKLNESMENTYSRTVQVVFYYHGCNLKGHEIDNISDTSVMLKYRIETEAREWGIKDMVLGNIQAVPELEMSVYYWPDDIDTKNVEIALPIDWSSAKLEVQTGKGVVTVGDEIEITLMNDKEGNLTVQEILIPVFGL